MPAMLPVASDGAPRLADVLPSALASLEGRTNRLELPPARSAVVVVVDGLGAANLRARAGHARFLASRMGRRDVATTVFPSTTAAALASFATGRPPGQHGLVGYSVLDPVHDRIVNQLSGWDGGMVPETWQRATTVFEDAAARGIRPIAVGAPAYATSGFTRAVLRGAEYLGGATADDRVAIALDAVRAETSTLVYLYVPELDQAGHREGWESDRWLRELEGLDAALLELDRGLGRNDGLLVTADHGQVDVPASRHVLVDRIPGLLDGVRHLGGEPRCLYVYPEPRLPREAVDALVDAWRASEEHRAWVLTRAEAIAAGLYGEVDAEVLPRLPELIVAARAGIAYYDDRLDDTRAQHMIGQHGSLTDEERRIPLVRAGAYAR